MNIVYFTHQFFPRHIGGTEVYALGLAHRAAKAGHQVSVVTYHESPSGDANDYGVVESEYQGLPVFEVHFNLSTAPNPARYEYDNPFIYERLSVLLGKLRPDMVHVLHAMKLSGSILDLFHRMGIPFVVTLCDFWFICPRHTLLRWDGNLCEGPAHRFSCVKCLQHTHGFAAQKPGKLPEGLLNMLLRLPGAWKGWMDKCFLMETSAISQRNQFLKSALLRACRIIALSNFQKTLFVRNGFDGHRIEVISHGLDLKEVKDGARLPGKPLRIVFIGSLVPHKGLHVVLKAFSRLPDRPVQFSVYARVESTSYGKMVTGMASEDPRVRMCGEFPPEQISQILMDHHVLAVPALWYENEPLVAKAALALGVPIMASRIGSLVEMIKENENGWLVSTGNSNEWARRLNSVISGEVGLTCNPRKVKSMDEHAEEVFQIYRKELKR